MLIHSHLWLWLIMSNGQSTYYIIISKLLYNYAHGLINFHYIYIILYQYYCKFLHNTRTIKTRIFRLHSPSILPEPTRWPTFFVPLSDIIWITLHNIKNIKKLIKSITRVMLLIIFLIFFILCSVIHIISESGTKNVGHRVGSGRIEGLYTPSIPKTLKMQLKKNKTKILCFSSISYSK